MSVQDPIEDFDDNLEEKLRNYFSDTVFESGTVIAINPVSIKLTSKDFLMSDSKGNIYIVRNE